MTVWGSQAFIKTLLFLPFICVEYILKCHLNVTEIYQQYTWIKTDGILITAFSKPSQGFTGSHVMFVISLEFDHACHRELFPCCTYFRSSSKLTFSNWNEKPSAKSKFLQWNSGTCFFFFFCSFIKLTTKKSALCSPVHASRMSTWGLLYLLQCLGLEAGLVSYTYTEACEYLLIKLW